jgi:hypothetical protein
MCFTESPALNKVVFETRRRRPLDALLLGTVARELSR